MHLVGIGLQLFTVRDQLKEDFKGTVASVAQMGYEGLEVGGEITAPQKARDLFDSLGLQVFAAHVGLEKMEEDIGWTADFVHTMGARYAVISWLSPERRKTAGDWISAAKTMNALANKLKARGLGLAYHNHNFEFETFDGRLGYDLLMENTDPALVWGELDTFWAAKAGQDVAAIIRRWACRFPLMHLKDISADAERTFEDVGEGTLDWPAIFQAAEELGGARYYIVEHDQPKNSLASARRSIENLRKMGKL